MVAVTYSRAVDTSPYYSVQLRKFGVTAIVTMLAFVLALGFLLPFGNMALLSVKTKDQIVASADGLIWPMEPEKFTYQDKAYDVYTVPFDDGTTRDLALVKKGRASSQFVDPGNPDAGLIEWQGNWRGLNQAATLQPHFENFTTAWEMIDFPLLFRNTL